MSRPRLKKMERWRGARGGLNYDGEMRYRNLCGLWWMKAFDVWVALDRCNVGAHGLRWGVR